MPKQACDGMGDLFAGGETDSGAPAAPPVSLRKQPACLKAPRSRQGTPQAGTTGMEAKRSRFEVWLEKHPDVAPTLYGFCLEVKKSGRNRFGMKALFERLRWYKNIETHDGAFKLNNNYHAPMARWMMMQYPDLEGFFELRERQ